MKAGISRVMLCGAIFGLSGAASAQQSAPAALPLVMPATTAPDKPDSPAVLAQIAAARTAAGAQWKDAVDYFCGRDPRVNDPSDPQLPPTKVFDNLYYIGAAGTGSWVVKTSEGLVMIDTGYPQHLNSVLLPGMAALKLNPADVRYALIGHGIWDHWGGAAYFQEKYGTRVLMGTSPGWNMTEKFEEMYLKPRQSRPPAIVAGRVAATPPPDTVPPRFDPNRDIKWTGQGVLSVGDTKFTIMDAEGGISIIFQVKDGATTHTAGLFGAMILVPAWRPMSGLQQYVETVNKWAELSKQMKVDVEIQNHPLFDGITEKAAAVRAGKKGREHPFVVGTEGYQRFVNVLSECAQVQIARRSDTRN